LVRWNLGKVQLNLTNGISYNILIEGVSGGFNGDIAIDDISFAYDNCEIGLDF
jgi:hypothetical protein